MNLPKSSAWRIEFDRAAERQLAKLDRAIQRRIVKFLRERAAADPRRIGDALQGPMRGYWRYRVGDYRIIAKIVDDRLIVLVIAVGHRRDIYN